MSNYEQSLNSAIQQYAGNQVGLKQADKARMDVALDELEGVINQLNESAKHLCSRVQRVSRPDLSTGVAEQVPKAIRTPSGPILDNLEGLTEKARKITHHLQDTLSRLEV